MQNRATEINLVEMERQRLEWSLQTFSEATPVSSLRKLESEISEIESNIKKGIKDPEEYADAMMCLLDSAGRDGISIEEILQAYALKLQKNKARKWKKNPDNSYSHVKDVEPETTEENIFRAGMPEGAMRYRQGFSTCPLNVNHDDLEMGEQCSTCGFTQH